MRHAFSDDMVLDIAAYNRDVLSDAAGRTVSVLDPTSSGNSNEVRVLTNADFGNTRGVDVRLDRRFGNFFSGTLAYTFQQAQNTGDDPLTYIAFGSRIVSQIGGGNTPPPQAILTTATNRPHTLAFAGSLSFPADYRQGTTLGTILKNFAVFATARYASGTAYSGCVNTPTNSVLLAIDATDQQPVRDRRLHQRDQRPPAARRSRRSTCASPRRSAWAASDSRRTRTSATSSTSRTRSGCSRATATSVNAVEFTRRLGHRGRRRS